MFFPKPFVLGIAALGALTGISNAASALTTYTLYGKVNYSDFPDEAEAEDRFAFTFTIDGSVRDDSEAGVFPDALVSATFSLLPGSSGVLEPFSMVGTADFRMRSPSFNESIAFSFRNSDLDNIGGYGFEYLVVALYDGILLNEEPGTPLGNQLVFFNNNAFDYSSYLIIRSDFVPADSEFDTGLKVSAQFSSLEVGQISEVDIADAIDLPDGAPIEVINSGWFRQTTTTADGIDAAQSGTNELNILELSTNFDGAQNVSFNWQVASGGDDDVFIGFMINGEYQTSINGNVPWTQASGFAVEAGSNQLLWYQGSTLGDNLPSDSGWLDQVTFSYRLGAPKEVKASENTVGGRVKVSWTAMNNVKYYQIYRNTIDDYATAAHIGNCPRIFDSPNVIHPIVIQPVDPAPPYLVTTSDVTYTPPPLPFDPIDPIVLGWHYKDTTAEPGVRYYYWVRAYNDSDKLGAPSESVMGYWEPHFDTWASKAGLEGERALPTAIPHHDGIENLLKFAFNLDGAKADTHSMTPGTGTSGLPHIMLHSSGAEQVLRFEYVRRRGQELDYTPQISDDMKNWNPTVALPTREPINDTWERVQIDEPIDMSANPKVFGRVLVIQLTPDN